MNILGHYLIIDGGDGSAHVKWFKTIEAAEAFEEFEMGGGNPDGRGSLSEGPVTLTQEDLDEALTMENVDEEIADHNEYADEPYVRPNK